MGELGSSMLLVNQKSGIVRSGLSPMTASQTTNEASGSEYQLSQPNTINKIDIMTPEIVGALDRAKVSNRNATFILAAAYNSVGIDLSSLNLSYSTLYRGRISFRKNITEDLKKEFHTEDRYVVHWDGKVLCDISNKKTVDRIAILISVSGVDQLIGVPKADSGTAHQQASAVISTLNQWNVAPYVKAMCFDTPSVNTGNIVLKDTIIFFKITNFVCRYS